MMTVTASQAYIFCALLLVIRVAIFLKYKNNDSKVIIAIEKIVDPVWAGFWATYSMFDELSLNLAAAWMLGFFVVLPIFKSVGFLSRSDEHEDSETTRGAVIKEAKETNKEINKAGKSHAEIGKVKIPVEVETRNFLFCGAPGAGKTQAFYQVLASVRQRGMTAIAADLGGEFVMRFYRTEQDVILNVFDKRTVNWSPFAEMRSSFDAAKIAQSIVPDAQGDAKQWHDYARGIIEVVLERLFENGNATNGALCYYALVADSAELGTLCAQSPASSNFAKGNERVLGSIRTILTNCIKPYTYLDPASGKDAFSIRDHIQAGKDAWLFLSYRDDQFPAIRLMIAAQIDIAAGAILSMSSELGRRCWFVLDEFATLGALNSIEPLLSKGRKYGVSAILGLQTIAQANLTFGRDKAQTLLACLGNWLILRTPDAETAEYMSKFLGDEEQKRVVESGGDNESGKSANWSQQIVRQRVLMPSEINHFPDLQGILKLAGAYSPTKTTIPISTLAKTAEGFVDSENTSSRRITRPESLGVAPAPAPAPTQKDLTQPKKQIEHEIQTPTNLWDLT